MDSAAFLSAVAYILSCILHGFVLADNAVNCPPEHKFWTGRKPSVTLKCTSIFPAAISNITWSFLSYNSSTGVPVELASLEDFTVSPQDGEKITLTIKNPVISHVGQYTLKVTVFGNGTFFEKVSTQLNMVPWVYLDNIKESMQFHAGRDHEIECLQGPPLQNVTFAWLREGQPVNEFTDPRIELTNNSQNYTNGKMILRNADYPDRAMFTCVATGQFGNDTAKVLLRVRSPTCWLYPFGGCFALLFTLAVILGIDSWHRKRSPKREEDYPEQHSPTTSKGSSKSGVSGEVKNFSEIVAVRVPQKGEPAFVSFKSLQNRELHAE